MAPMDLQAPTLIFAAHSEVDRCVPVRGRGHTSRLLRRLRKSVWCRAIHTIGVRDYMLCSPSVYKKRLAPLKKVTLPRLESLAALLRARLLRYFCHETGFVAILWSDSTVTLGWIRATRTVGKPSFPIVSEILTSTTPSQWRQCPGFNNRTDHLSRGLREEALRSLDSWCTGPDWLVQHPDSWPHYITPCDAPLPEAKKTAPQVLMVLTPEPLLPISHISSYSKLLHVTVWVLRFVKSL
jgi:hypothetical protein